jgi:hypothetical protein
MVERGEELLGAAYRPLAPDALGVDLAAARAERANSPLLENVLAVLRQVARAESQPNPMLTDRSR